MNKQARIQSLPVGTLVSVVGQFNSPTMTVNRSSDYQVECLWFTEDHKLNTGWFSFDTLVEYEDE